MEKQKDYTVSIDIHVSLKDEPGAKRRYSMKMYGHPLMENPEPFNFEISNMRDEMALRVGKQLLNTIWSMVGINDKTYWD